MDEIHANQQLITRKDIKFQAQNNVWEHFNFIAHKFEKDNKYKT